MFTRSSVAAALCVLVLAGCGGDEASSCSDIAEEVVDLVQDLIDEVEQEVADVSAEDLLTLGEEALPSIDRFRVASEEIDARASDLGCTQSELETLVGDRTGRLSSETPIGRLIIEGIESGGL